MFGDGTRTAQSYTPYTDGQPGTPVFTRYYFGGAYETTGSAWKKYYSFGGTTLMRDASGFKYFLSDHLGSVSVVLSATGTILEQQRYLPFGQARVMPPYASVTSTDFTYTGQRNLPDTGLMDYKARFYSPTLGRFIQPDNIIPDPANPQTWNRYTYANNNPTRYTDPDGHFAIIPALIVIGIVVGIWLVAAPPAYAPSSEEDLATRVTAAESNPSYKIGKWIDKHPILFVVAVAVVVHSGAKAIELLTAAGEAVEQSSEPKSLKGGNKFHYGEGGGPDQLQDMYPDTDFKFTRRGERGADVQYDGGTHPSEYPDSTWESGNDYGDFKPNSPGAESRFTREIKKGKLPPNTQPLPYYPKTGKLLPKHKFGLWIE